MRAAVIFDMDGTLADCQHRIHFVDGSQGRKNWEKFFAGSGDDGPREDMIRLAVELSATNAILIASGRPEHLRRVTEKWLQKHEVPFERIYLRGNNDRRSDGIVKAEILALMRADGFEPWLAVDDRDSAVESWREQGLSCLQCAESQY